MALQKISSYDSFYQTGYLSDFPLKTDSYQTLYEARNLSESTLKSAVNFGSTSIVVEDGIAPIYGMRSGIPIYADEIINLCLKKYLSCKYSNTI